MDKGVTSHYHAGVSLAETSYIHYCVPGVVVNGNGERFVSEIHFLHRGAAQVQGGTDDRLLLGLRRSGQLRAHAQRQQPRASTTRSCWRPATSSRARTTRTLPKRRGFSDLVATLDTVNDCAVNGAEDPFGNENLPALQLDGPMYAMKILPTPYIAQGGVKVDLSGHVQREDDSLIEGLYAAGDVTGAIGEPRWSRLHDRPHAGGWLWSRRRRNGSSRPGIARFAPQGAGRLRKEAAGVGTLSAAPPPEPPQTAGACAGGPRRSPAQAREQQAPPQGSGRANKGGRFCFLRARAGTNIGIRIPLRPV